MKPSSRVMLAVFAVLTIVLGGAAFAWACGPQATVRNSPDEGVAGDPGSGTPGTTFQVSGTNFREGPVSIHWNSANGPLLGTTSGPAFSIAVTVPYGQSEGVHNVIGVQDGVTSPPAPFTVTGTAAPAESESSGGGGGGGGETSATASGNDGRGGKAEQRKTEQPTRGDAPASANPPVVTTASGEQVFGPSIATQTGTVERARQAHRERTQSETPTYVRPSGDDVTSAAGLFNGLESPSVLPSPLDSVVGAGSGSSPLKVAAAFLGAGLVILFLGVLFVEVRRRRMVESEGGRLS